VVGLLLAVGFIATNWTKHYNYAAVLEWIIGYFFVLYIFSFYADLWPAVYTRQHDARHLKRTPRQMEEVSDGSLPRRPEPTHMERAPANF
jgi:hypothetical protein